MLIQQRDNIKFIRFCFHTSAALITFATMWNTRFNCKKGILTCVYKIYGEFPLQKLLFVFPFSNVCWVIFYDFAFFIFITIATKNRWEIKWRNEKLRNSFAENVFHVWPTFKCLSSSFPLREGIRYVVEGFSKNFNSTFFRVSLISNVHYPDFQIRFRQLFDKTEMMFKRIYLERSYTNTLAKNKLNHSSNCKICLREWILDPRFNIPSIIREMMLYQWFTCSGTLCFTLFSHGMPLSSCLRIYSIFFSALESVE